MRAARVAIKLKAEKTNLANRRKDAAGSAVVVEAGDAGDLPSLIRAVRLEIFAVAVPLEIHRNV